jgi:very-short-patch-repair endonuclease
MHKSTPTKATLFLNEALNTVGIKTILEHNDGFKHVDIFVPKGNIYIEVDGLQHYTNAKQIVSDFDRDHYSDIEGFRTLRIPNEVVLNDAIWIARAIKKMVSEGICSNPTTKTGTPEHR